MVYLGLQTQPQRRCYRKGRRGSVFSNRRNSDSSDDDNVLIHIDDSLKKAARMIASSKAEVSNQVLLSRFLYEWHLTVSTRYQRPFCQNQEDGTIATP